MSGGATKAFYFHLGVLKVLQPHNISSIIGTSAGSVIGAFIASGANVDNLITSLYQKEVYVPKFDAWVKTFTSTMLFRPKFRNLTQQSVQSGIATLRLLMSLPAIYNRDLVAEVLDRLIDSQMYVSGFFDANVLEDLFKSLLPSNDFRDTDIDLYVTATSLDNHERAVFNGNYDFIDHDSHFMNDVPIHKAVRASTSLPGMFEPVKVKGKYYIDGEIKQTLSVDIGLAVADKIIISHTYQPVYLPNPQSVRDLGWLSILKQSLSIVLQERINTWRDLYEAEYPEKEMIWIQPDPEDLEFFLAPEFSFRPEAQKKMIRSGEVAALKALGLPVTT
ncbi:MAG: patatin-like phospholipase family protein [Chloroflexi bacterium]|nr:patatin-like phospholipase family protein [Chloroflexota bacterium]